MTDNNHLITPPLKLFREWTEYRGAECEDQFWWRIATQAARWGADAELEACCEWLVVDDWKSVSKNLRAARRPKPPSHKELALIALTALEACAAQSSDTTESVFYIRRALESLPD